MTGRAIPSLPTARGKYLAASTHGTPEEAAETRSDLLAARIKYGIIKALNEAQGVPLDADQVGQLSGLLLGRIDPPDRLQE